MTDTKYAFYKCGIGYLRIGYIDSAVTYLKCAEAVGGEDVRSAVSDLAYVQLCEYLDGKRADFDFPVDLRGTEFQRRAWCALREIPYGQTRTYKQIADSIGSPKACRAVGAANHANPVWIAVPCHRVVGADGSLTGYAGGLNMKRFLLELEQRHSSCFSCSFRPSLL